MPYNVKKWQHDVYYYMHVRHVMKGGWGEDFHLYDQFSLERQEWKQIPKHQVYKLPEEPDPALFRRWVRALFHLQLDRWSTGRLKEQDFWVMLDRFNHQDLKFKEMYEQIREYWSNDGLKETHKDFGLLQITSKVLNLVNPIWPVWDQEACMKRFGMVPSDLRQYPVDCYRIFIEWYRTNPAAKEEILIARTCTAAVAGAQLASKLPGTILLYWYDRRYHLFSDLYLEYQEKLEQAINK